MIELDARLSPNFTLREMCASATAALAAAGPTPLSST